EWLPQVRVEHLIRRQTRSAGRDEDRLECAVSVPIEPVLDGCSAIAKGRQCLPQRAVNTSPGCIECAAIGTIEPNCHPEPRTERHAVLDLTIEDQISPRQVIDPDA